MSGKHRALIALAAVFVSLVLSGFVSSSVQEVVDPAPTPQPPIAPSAAATLVTSEPVLAVLPTSTPIPSTPTLARREFPASVQIKAAPTSFLPGRGPRVAGELVYSGRWIDVYVGRNTFSPAEVAELGVKAEWALSYIQRRFAVRLRERVSVGVYNPSMSPSRGTRGIAYTRDNIAQIFYRPGESRHNALVILTHELAHHLQADAYGNDAQQRADIVLLEGLATWITGEYWLSLSGAPSWPARSRELHSAGYVRNLVTVARTADSDTAYEVWAGFVDYLTTTYGWEKFNALYVSGRGRYHGSADYQGIYGKSFTQLADEWRATLP